jgi:thiamine-phosphate pyrophosphorylase
MRPPTRPAATFDLLLVTAGGCCGDAASSGVDRAALLATVGAALAGARPGEVALEVREPDLPARELLALCLALRPITASAGALLLVNDRLDVALACEADGVHLPSHGLAPGEARRLLGDRLLGVSTHSAGEVAQARASGANYALFGPVFATPSKARFGPPQGLDALAAAAGCAGEMPLYAVGGVDQGNAAACVSRGCRGVAVIRAVLAAGDPAAALAGLVAAVRHARSRQE